AEGRGERGGRPNAPPHAGRSSDARRLLLRPVSRCPRGPGGRGRGWRRGPSLLIPLDALLWPHLALLRVSSDLPTGLSLVEEVIALVELDADRLESRLLGCAEAG